MLNSKAAGRVLAAGGVYNGNVAGFRKTAEQLGGDAVKGYDQVLNETTKGAAIAVASIAGGLGKARLNSLKGTVKTEKAVKTENYSSKLAYLVNGKEFAIEALSQSGSRIDPSVKSGNLTVAGRALQKHGSRPDSAFPVARGAPAKMNEQGKKILDSIIKSPSTTVKEGNRFGGFDIISADGKGSRFDSNGSFRGFLEP